MEWIPGTPHTNIIKWIRKLGVQGGHGSKEDKKNGRRDFLEHLENKEQRSVQRKNLNSNEVLFRAKTTMKEWNLRNELTPDDDINININNKGIVKTCLVKWQSPPLGTVKINFDGSVKGKETSTGYIIRDHKGKLINAGATKLGEASYKNKKTKLGEARVLLAEATRLRDGVKNAWGTKT